MDNQMKTIIIYDAKVLESDRDIVQITRMDDINLYNEFCGNVSPEIKTELVKSLHIVNPKTGVDVFIGCDQKIQDAIGIQYEAFRNMQSMIRAQGQEIWKMSQEICEIKNAGFWTRLKWLFLGVGKAQGEKDE